MRSAPQRVKALVQLSCTTKAGQKLSRESASQGARSMLCTATHVDMLQIPAMVLLLLFLGALSRAYVANICLYCLSQFKKGTLWIYMLCSTCPKGAQATLELPSICGSSQQSPSFHPTDSHSERGQWDLSGQWEAFPQSWLCPVSQVLPEWDPVDLGSPPCQRPVDPLLAGWDSLLGAAFTHLLIGPVRDVHRESVVIALGGRAGEHFFCNKVVVLIT